MVVVHVRNSLRKAAAEAAAAALEPLPSRVEGRPLKWYACGPTVYDSAHLGHARTYVCQDIIRRILTDVFGYQVFYCMGVTDVDDKIIQRARVSKQDPSVVSRRYEAEFWRDMDALGVRRPTAVVRVTEHMDVIREYITAILDKGLAYQSKDGIYFDVKEFSKSYQYGKLSLDPGTQGAALAEGDDSPAADGGKKDPRDFALWKLAKPGEPVWESPWGGGRPGWHIECSAMTHHVLGDRFDLHSGGVDLKFPHHNNEIAQCEAFTGREHDWVSTWIHTGHLYIKGLKMSKSLKNFITIRSLLLDHHPDDFRFFCLMHKYSASIDYSESQMAEAHSLRRHFLNFTSLARPHSPSSPPPPSSLSVPSDWPSKRWGPAEFTLHDQLVSHSKAADEALGRDFDTPEALRHLQALMSAAHKYERERMVTTRGGSRGGMGVVVEEAVASVAAYVSRVMDLLGVQSVGRGMYSAEGEGASKVASRDELSEAFVSFRSQVRTLALGDKGQGDLKGSVLRLCDTFRDRDLHRLGLEVQDLPGGKRARWVLGDKATTKGGDDGGDDEKEEGGEGGAKAKAAAGGDGARALPAWKGVDKKSIEATELFKHGPYEGLYAKFDDDGIPTHTVDGEEVSKTQRSKLKKKWLKHQGKKWGGGPPSTKEGPQ